MKLDNEALKSIYFGAYSFKDTEDGYLQAFQYSDAQIEYFRVTEVWHQHPKHLSL